MNDFSFLLHAPPVRFQRTVMTYNPYKQPVQYPVPPAIMDSKKLMVAIQEALRRARAEVASADKEFAVAYAAWHKEFLSWLKKEMPNIKDASKTRKKLYKYKYGHLSRLLEGAPDIPENEKEKRERKARRLEDRLNHLRYRIEKKKPIRMTPEQLRNYLAGEFVESRTVL